MTLIAAAGTAAAACEPQTFRDWRNDCKQIWAATAVLLKPNDVATQVMLTYDGSAVRLTAAIPYSYYQRFWTGSPPTIAEFAGVRYVADSTFFNKEAAERFPTTLQVGPESFTLVWDGAPHWRLPAGETRRALDAFRRGLAAEITYSHFSRGRDQHVVISLLGFSAALDDFEICAPSAPPEMTTSSAIDLIGRHLIPNDQNIDADDLQVARNPRGEGFFVFVRTRSGAGTRWPLYWFVNAGVATSLNGASQKLTPDLPFPRLVDFRVWHGSNLDGDSVGTVGRRTVIEDR